MIEDLHIIALFFFSKYNAQSPFANNDGPIGTVNNFSEKPFLIFDVLNIVSVAPFI